MVDWYKHKLFVPEFIKKLSEAEATYALRRAWFIVYGNYPSDKSLALLWSQSALETGRWKEIHNNNFGNIKKRHANTEYKIKDDGHYFTMYRCSEVLYDKSLKKHVEKWFDPPHTQTHFRAYPTPVEGAEDYIRLLSKKTKYQKVWKQVILGDPIAYSHELKVAGYYTASEAKYTKGVVSLTAEFMRKKDELLAWAPEPELEPEPEPEEEIIILPEEVISPDFSGERPTIPDVPHPSSYPPPVAKNKGVMVAIGVALAGIITAILSKLEGCF